MSETYSITTERDSIVIRLPREGTDERALGKLLDYLELESLRQRSGLTPEDAQRLAQEVKQGAWAHLKHLFTEE